MDVFFGNKDSKLNDRFDGILLSIDTLFVIADTLSFMVILIKI